MKKKLTLDELDDELPDDAPDNSSGGRSPVDARVIAGFEDIVRFVDEHGRRPAHGVGNDIFERLYAVRLDRIRANPAFRALVANLDVHGLLAGATDDIEQRLDDDTLLAELEDDTENADDITQLKHVKARDDITVAEDVASRIPCRDFQIFKPLFAKVQNELDTGARETRPFKDDASIAKGDFFIVSGQMAFVAEMGKEERRTKTERTDSRLRVIYDNGMESDILMRSLQRALNKDKTGRRITDISAGPLFGNVAAKDDIESGTIYVLRSLSEDPQIAPHRALIHKIGVTGGDVDIRISNAALDATYLLADVEVIATYKLFNINRTRLENLLHRIFSSARLDVEIKDRFGNPVRPREWFLVPLHVIEEVVNRISDQSIFEYAYDPKQAALKKVGR
ncbi:MAG: GIY-YIG nuclease family protein [Hyphomicrobium sp.]